MLFAVWFSSFFWVWVIYMYAHLYYRMTAQGIFFNTEWQGIYPTRVQVAPPQLHITHPPFYSVTTEWPQKTGTLCMVRLNFIKY